MKMLVAGMVALTVVSVAGAVRARQADEVPVLEPHTAATICDVSGVLVQEGLLAIRCAQPTDSGLSLFVVQRENKRFDDIRDFAIWAQEKGRPLGIVYLLELRHSPNACKPQICRAIFAVERR